jgi:uncharacterized protein YoxC
MESIQHNSHLQLSQSASSSALRKEAYKGDETSDSTPLASRTVNTEEHSKGLLDDVSEVDVLGGDVLEGPFATDENGNPIPQTPCPFPPLPPTDNLEAWLDYMEAWTDSFHTAIQHTIDTEEPFMTNDAAFHFMSHLPNFPGSESQPTTQDFMHRMATMLDTMNAAIHHFHELSQTLLTKCSTVAEKDQRHTQIQKVRQEVNDLFQMVSSWYASVDQETTIRSKVADKDSPQKQKAENESKDVQEESPSRQATGCSKPKQTKDATQAEGYHPHFVIIPPSKKLPHFSPTTDYIYRPTFLLRHPRDKRAKFEVICAKEKKPTKQEEKVQESLDESSYTAYYSSLYQKFKVKFLDVLLHVPNYTDEDIQHAFELQLKIEKTAYENQRSALKEEQTDVKDQDTWKENYPDIYIRNRFQEFLPSFTKSPKSK